MIAIVDYGVGNLTSVKRMLERCGVASEISSSPEFITNAEKVILPGVGSFDYGMEMLERSGLLDVLNEHAVFYKKPLLGICLGMQLLFSESNEGNRKGLGWLDGKVVHFDRGKLHAGLKIPHMGWSNVMVQKSGHLLQNLENDARFYFVHSYHLSDVSESDVLLTATYGYEFVCGVEHENILGVQFHPEKSHRFGMKLLENFALRY